ncbi:MAG: serine protease, partial [Acidimicrobiales bacterium]
MRCVRRSLLAAAVASLGLLGVGLSPTAVAAAPTWAPEASATIHPGVQTDTNGGQCTANFIFTAGSDVDIGQAAHCSSTRGQTDTDGYVAGSLPLGTPVTIDGAAHPGTLAYNSWLTMQSLGEADPNTCAYNDLALVRLDPADVASVNPTIPHWGGPTGADGDGTTTGERVFSYGNSSLRFGITQLSPKTGVSLGSTNSGGW